MRSRRSFPSPTLGRLWTFLAVALPAFAALLVPMPAVDLAYQLRAGAQIVEGEGIPAVDTWTFTVAGTPWLDQQWGAQAILAGAFRLGEAFGGPTGGWTALTVLRAALVALTFALLLRAVRSAWSIASVRAGGSAIASSARTAALVTLLAFVVAAPALALRPQLFGIVLFVASMVVLVERAQHPRRLWLIPVFAAAWANLHGSFPLVIVLVALAWIDEVALLREPLPAGQAAPSRRARLLGSTGVTIIGVAAAAATLLNPFGLDVWRYIQDLAGNPAITSQVSEWRPPSLLDPPGAVFYVSLLVVVGVVAFRFRSDGGLPPARFTAAMFAVVIFGALGVFTGRGLAWWALAAPVALVSLQPGLKLADAAAVGLPRIRARTAREAAESESRRSPLNAMVMGVLILASVALLPLWRPLGPAGVPLAALSHAPQGIAAELARMSSGGDLHVWAPQTWASFFEWAATDNCYAVDSRIELFSADLWDDARRLSTGTGEWLSILDEHGVDAFVVPVEQARALEPTLETSGTWTRSYTDADGSIWAHTARLPSRPLQCPGSALRG